MIVTDGLFAAAARTPEKVAIRCADERLTYRELVAAIVRWSESVGSARQIAVVMHNTPAALAAFLGAARGGATVLALDPSWPADLRARVVVRHRPARVIDGDAVPAIAGTPQRPTPETAFLMGFTSGTTDVPKAFLRTHESWIATFAAARVEFGPVAAGSVLAPGPLCHSLTLYTAVETLEAGGTVVLQSRFDADACTVLMAAGEVDCLVGVPSMFDLVLAATKHPVEARLTFISAGAKLAPGLRSRVPTRYPAARMFEYYGASELSFITVAAPADQSPPESVGRAFHSVDVAVRRADGTLADIGEIGKVWVRSPMLSLGYVDPADEGGFSTDGATPPWATVGDRGSLDANGFLFLAGREGDMMISGGHNIYPNEIEQVLETVAGVRAAAVVGVPDPRWGQRVTAVIEGIAARAALENACVAALPRSKLPRDWRRIATMPRTASGKIARSRLLDLLPDLETLR